MAEERSLATLKQILKDKYKTNDKIECLFYPENPLPLADCYLDLALIEEKEFKSRKVVSGEDELIASSLSDLGIYTDTKNDLSSREYFLHEYERIEHIQKKLAIESILAECKYPKKRIYIEGAAGAGKSTLSRYLANEWANDKAPWNQYEWVFYIRLRNLTADHYTIKQAYLLQVLEQECFKFGFNNCLNEKEKNKFSKKLRLSNKNILFILDGFDELQISTNYIRLLWETIIKSDFDVLVTSRPGSLLLKESFEVNLNLALLGFSDEQIKKYIRNFFNLKYIFDVQMKDADRCLAFIKNNPNLWSLSHTPIQLEFICSIWKDLEKKQQLPITELYRVMLERLLQRRVQKEGLNIEEFSRKQLKARYADYLTYMEYLAFLAMQTQRIVLTEQEINTAYKILPPKKHKQVDFYKKLKALGIVKRYNNGQQAEFAHLTFQEFFAAKYVASAIKAFSENKPHSLSHQDLLNFVSRTKWDNFYEVMWWFVAGLLGGSSTENAQRLEHYKFYQGDSNSNEKLDIPKSHQRLQTLQTFFDLLLQEPREPLEVFELPLLVSCLAEANQPDILQRETIKQHFERWLEFYWIKESEILKNTVLRKLIQVLQNHRELVVWIQPFLLQRLQNTSLFVCYPVVEAVIQLGGSANETLQAGILPLLQNKMPFMRCLAVEAVGQLGGSASEALQAGLLLLLQDKEEYVRYSAVKAVSLLGASANGALKKELELLLQDTSKHVRCIAAEAVGKLGSSASEALQVGLLPLLQDTSEDVCLSAAIAMGQLDETANEILQTRLLPWFQNANTDVRRSAAAAVGFLGISANKTLQKGLLLLLQDTDKNVRRTAVTAVGKLGVCASEELKKGLLPLLQDDEASVRSSVAEAVGKLSGPMNEVLQAGFLLLLQDKDWFVRHSTAIAVGRIGVSTSETLQTDLLKFLQDTSEDVRRTAAVAVGFFGMSAGEALQRGLFPLLQDKNDDVCSKAAEAVGRIGASANEALQRGLLMLLQDKLRSARLRRSVAEAIGFLGKSASEALQIGLLSLLQDKDEYVRRLTTVAIGRIGTSASETFQAGLLLLLQSADKDVRISAIESVKELGRSSNVVLQTGLLPLLQDKDEHIRRLTVEVVGRLGVTMNVVLQASLLPLLQDESMAVCSAAKRALATTKSGLVLLCQEIFKKRPLSVPSSRLIVSSENVVKVNQYGELDCLKLCGTVLQNIIHNEFSHHLTEEEWTLAIVRKKETNDLNQATSSHSFFKPLKNIQNHAFLILEGVKVSVRFAIKLDLYAVGKKRSQSSGQKVAIQITNIDDFTRLQELADNSCSMVHGISREQAEQLLENIKQDQASAERGEIVYCLMGDGSSSSTSTVQKHSCISWCLEKWQQIGLPLKRKWYDTVVVIPSVYLESAKQSEEKDKCLIM